MTVRAVFAVALMLIACEEGAPTYRMVKSPDGNHWWYDITCSGRMANCLEDARKVCHGRLYKWVESDGTESGSGDGKPRYQGTAPWTGLSLPTIEIMVQCSPLRKDNDREILPPGTPAAPKDSE